MKINRENKMKRLTTFLILIFLAGILNAQVNLEKELTDYKNPEELVSLSESIPFKQAIEVLSTVSEKLTGKKIVSTSMFEGPIGIEIKNIPYWKALIIITQYNSLEYEERQNVIVIKDRDDPTKDYPEEVYAPVSEREVRISGLLFEANVQEMRELGINWELILQQNGLTIGSDLLTFSDESQQQQEGQSDANLIRSPDFNVSTESEFTMGDFTGNASALFKFFETNNLGEIVSRPNVTVRNKKAGRIQIGADISIKQRDFAGNIIDVFYPTGTIIEVTPYIYEEDGLTYILLQLKVERSSASVDALSTQINKTVASTEVLMLDGEQTVIGGLLVNESTNVRRGIPFLKDLPWWVFGIRYLAGYDQEQIVQKEVIILIEAELMKPLKQRIEDLKNNKIVDQRNRNLDALESLDNSNREFREVNKERIKKLLNLDKDDEEEN